MQKKNFSSEESVYTPTTLPLNSKIKCSVPEQNKSGNNCNFYWSGYIL